MANTNLIDLLLCKDIEDISKIKKDVEITRLSRALGCEFIVTCNALTSEQLDYISDISKKSSDIKINTILEGCKIDGKKLVNAELIQKFGVDTPKELVEKLFLIGEIGKLYEEVSKLSGYGTDAVKEVKNS